jgi:hypothetical protein
VSEQGGESERARLWALYFGLRGLTDPPLFLRRTEAELGRYLAVDGPDTEPPALLSRGHLRRLK